MGKFDDFNDDFVFDDYDIECAFDRKKFGHRNSGKASTSGETNEDWDRELMEEQVVLEDEEVSEPIPLSEDSLDASNSDLSLFDEAKPETSKMESLLEYLDHIDRTEHVESTEEVLPRPPTLYSARQTSRSTTTRHQHSDLSSTNVRIAAISSNSSSQASGTVQDSTEPNFVSTSSCSHFGYPHAPESGPGVIAWLSNVSAKVRTTRAVVARPAPKLINGRECERLPSEEVQLETDLRLAEMVYCSRRDIHDESWLQAYADISKATVHVKGLLRRIDEARIRVRGQLPLLLALGGEEHEIFDTDSRTQQCCSRLVRLVCRVAQRSDELLLKSKNVSETTSTNIIDTTDISTLRRLAQAFIDDIRSAVTRLKLELLVEEALGHLALLHCRGPRKMACKRDLGDASCYCSALPPLPRAGIAKIISTCRSLMVSHPFDVELEQIEACALADLLLDTAGYSPLSCEQLLTEQGMLSEYGGDDGTLRTDHPSLGEASSKNLLSVIKNESISLESPDTLEVNANKSHFERCENGNLFQSKNMMATFNSLSNKQKAHRNMLLPSTRELELRLGLLIRVLPPQSLARAKAAFAVGVSHLRGGERLAIFTKKAKLKKKEPPAVAAAQTELRSAEMLLFEAACIIEQHSAIEPVDLPCYACRYAEELSGSPKLGNIEYVGNQAAPGITKKSSPATTYSALTSSLGFAIIRALARALDRRSKHAYSVLALEICVAMLELHDDRVQRRRLHRELAIVGARQGDCSRYCLNVLHDLDDKFASGRKMVDTGSTSTIRDVGGISPQACRMIIDNDSCFPSVSPQRRTTQIITLHHSETFALGDVHELLLVTDLAVSRLTRSSSTQDYLRARDILIELARRLENRLRLVEPEASAAKELERLLDRLQLGMARLAFDQMRQAEAASILDACLASGRKCPITRRIVLLSWVAKARLALGDYDACRAHIRRIMRIRKMRHHTSGLRGWFRAARFEIDSSNSVPDRSSTRSSKILDETSKLSSMTKCENPSSLSIENCSGTEPNYKDKIRYGTGRDLAAVNHLLIRNEGPSILVGEACASGILSEGRSCLLKYCGPLCDVAELDASDTLARGDAIAALRALSPAIANVEACVSHQATQQGLAELGRLYKLRGFAQDALSRSAIKSDFPLRLERQDSLPNDLNFKECLISNNFKQDEQIGIEHDKRKKKILREPPMRLFKKKKKSSYSYVLRFFQGSVNKRKKSIIHAQQQVLTKEKVKDEHHLQSKVKQSITSSRRSLNEKKNSSISPAASPQPNRWRETPRSDAHFRSYLDAKELAFDALRWYRHALECFRACGDDLGVAQCASAFARLQLERLIGPVALERIPLETAINTFLFDDQLHSQQNGGIKVLDAIDAAARCALSIAAVSCELFLLLETYLNVAELRLIKRDRLGAIAHWWEARELFLRLLVSGLTIPVVTNKYSDVATIEKIRTILERLVRFLAACDRAMINENIVLFEIFIAFERDARNCYDYFSSQYFLTKSPWISNTNFEIYARASSTSESCLNCVGDANLRCFDFERAQAVLSGMDHSVHALNSLESRTRSAGQLHLSSSAVDYAHRSSFGLSNFADAEAKLFRLRLGILSDDTNETLYKKNEKYILWEFLVRMCADVTQYRRLPLQPLSNLRDRNRCTLHLLASHLRILHLHDLNTTNAISYDTISSSANYSMDNPLKTLMYALHVASTLFIYCPLTGARHAVNLGSGSFRYRIKTNSSGNLRSTSISTTGARALYSRQGKREFIPAELSFKSVLLVVALAVDSTRRLKSRHPASHRIKSATTFRRSMLHSLKNDLDVSPELFDELLVLKKSKQNKSPRFIRLICSERTQFLPWECLTGDTLCITRSSGGVLYPRMNYDTFSIPSPQDHTIELLAPLCRRDILYAVMVCLIRMGRYDTTEGAPDPLIAAVAPAKHSADGSINRCLTATAGRRGNIMHISKKSGIILFERQSYIRAVEKREVGAIPVVDLDKTVLVFNSVLLSSCTDALKSLLDDGQPVLFAPTVCLDAVRMEMMKYLKNLRSQDRLSPSTFSLKLHKFAHAMTRKYVAPIIYFEIPPKLST